MDEPAPIGVNSEFIDGGCGSNYNVGSLEIIQKAWKMISLHDQIDLARGKAQHIHQQLDDQLSSDQASLKAAQTHAAAEAKALGDSLEAHLGDQEADVKLNVQKAVLALHEASAKVSMSMHATGAEVKSQSEEMLTRIRTAIDNLSHAVAARRAKKVHSPGFATSAKA